MTAKRVMIDDEVFTVVLETRNAFGGIPGVLYYEFAERPGELYRASRTRPELPPMPWCEPCQSYHHATAECCGSKPRAEINPYVSPEMRALWDYERNKVKRARFAEMWDVSTLPGRP